MLSELKKYAASSSPPGKVSVCYFFTMHHYPSRTCLCSPQRGFVEHMVSLQPVADLHRSKEVQLHLPSLENALEVAEIAHLLCLEALAALGRRCCASRSMEKRLPHMFMVLKHRKSYKYPLWSLMVAVLHGDFKRHYCVARVVLKKGKTQLFKDGSPMVYSGAVDRIIGRPPPRTGDIVLVADGAEKPIGWGMYNSVSMFCVRLMQLEEEATRDLSCALNMEKLLETRINEAIELRKSLGLPSASTNAFRLVNSEGDRLSGLIVDVFGDVAVIASSAAWVEKYKPEVEACVGRIDEINYITWRPSSEVLKEEGLDASNYKERDPSICPQRTKVMENGIFYAISLEGQKTGFYADQCENRQFISTISDGQRVLDMFCYSGGFALNAARGGAVNVIGVDSSLPAVELAKENIVLNNMDPGRITFLREDASEFMKGALSRNESWDIVILDPPKLAPRKKALQNASGMYRNLNSLAMQLTKRGGLLMTCSCSGAMTQSGMFLRILQGAASAAGRKIIILREAGAACDHPIDPSYPEGKYLSNILLRVL